MSGYKLAVKKPVLKTHHLSQLKLPIFQKKNSEQQSKALKKIRSGKLPQLISQGEHPQTVQSQLYQRCSSEVTGQLPYDIQERVNNILNKNQVINHEYYNEENENFQANVLRNKELLKLQREKRGSILSKYRQDVSNGEQEKNKKHSKEVREKKKNNSKKALSKLKFSGEAPQIKSRIEALSLREDSRLNFQSIERGDRSSPGRKVASNRLEQKVIQIKTKISKRTQEKEERLHTEGQDYESENLFDNIHNYLANPHRNSQEHHTSSKSKLVERKQALEEKLRNIECRLSADKHNGRVNRTLEDVPLVNGSQEIDSGVTWRRIRFQDPAGTTNPKKISVDASTFEREVSHLGNLQQKNQYSLQRYVQNQRLLHSLKMVRDKSSRQYLKRQFLSK